MKKCIDYILNKYSHLIAESLVDVKKYFELMEKWEKPCTEIEICAHCRYPEREELFFECKEWLIDCQDCPYSDPHTLEEIKSFQEQLKKCGYYVYRNKRWDLSVSKIRSIAYWCSVITPPWRNAGIRGLFFGYSLEDIKDYIERTGEDEIVLD